MYVLTRLISDQCLMYNTDLAGGHLKTISYTTTTACKKACEDKKLCVAYSVNPSGNACILRRNTHAAESVLDGWISARMSCYEGI